MTEPLSARAPLIDRIRRAPLGNDDPRVAAAVQDLEADVIEAARDAGLVLPDRIRQFLNGIFAGSPYLSGLIRRDPYRLVRMLAEAPEETRAKLLEQVANEAEQAQSIADVMAALRRFKNEIALLTALADLVGVWDLSEVMGAVTQAAAVAVPRTL